MITHWIQADMTPIEHMGLRGVMHMERMEDMEHSGGWIDMERIETMGNPHTLLHIGPIECLHGPHALHVDRISMIPRRLM